jgi:hypothetical protein
MKNIWKWILGIVLIVVVIAGLAGAVFAVHNMMAANIANRQVVINPVPRGTPGPQGEEGRRNGNGPMQGGFRGWHEPGRAPMMDGGRFGFSPFRAGAPFHRPFHFGPGFMILGGLMRLIPLALLALLLVGAYLLGKRAQPAGTAVAAPSATHACPKCGEPVQDGSKYCPSCGKKQ